MKFVFILFVIGIFCLRIFAEDSISVDIVKNHNRNVSRDLNLKVVKIFNNEIVKNTTYAQTQTKFAKSKEEALTEFNATKIGGGFDMVDKYYDELKKKLGALNRTFFRSTTLFNNAIEYYKNYIPILMVVYEPQVAHDETKGRAIAKFVEEARSDNELFDSFKQKLEKELDYEFHWTFPEINTSGWFQWTFPGATGSPGGSNNHNSNSTLGNTTNANNSTEATTTKISKKKDD